MTCFDSASGLIRPAPHPQCPVINLKYLRCRTAYYPRRPSGGSVNQNGNAGTHISTFPASDHSGAGGTYGGGGEALLFNLSAAVLVATVFQVAAAALRALAAATKALVANHS